MVSVYDTELFVALIQFITEDGLLFHVNMPSVILPMLLGNPDISNRLTREEKAHLKDFVLSR